MWITAKIRKFIFGLADGQTFATRELLNFGPRKAVDSALYRLIDKKIIVRAARGVFFKPSDDNENPKMPPLAQIVATKTRAFSKDALVQHGKDAAQVLGIATQGNLAPTVVASGSSTSFVCESSDYGNCRVHIRNANPLSRRFGNSHIGLFFRAMKSLPQADRKLHIFLKAQHKFDRTQRQELRDASMWMPGWLAQMFWLKPQDFLGGYPELPVN